MRMLLALLPCALLSSGAMAEPFFVTERAPTMLYSPNCGDPTRSLSRMCIEAQLKRAAPCKGSVEERLNCLEAKIAQRDFEMQLLRWELENARRPRVHPLDERISLEQ